MDVLDDLHAALDGRYEIERELGRGGMAVVYLARDLKHDRQVAIKVLPPEMVTSVGAERFLREIRTAAQLSHPNILPLHDSIAVGQVRCYVMPYVQGESLRQRIDRERQLGIEQAVDITRQVAAGLDYAHAHGIVHRDIKPENILLVGDQAVIADFGLALAVFSANSTPFTATGMAVGTPAYMSPEQAAADHAIDGRTDVYSLGCLFFEMVAGMPPFRGATAGALLAAHATRTPPSLCAERGSCPPGMDAAVQRALAKVPADRFRTAGEFAHALETWRASSASPGRGTRRRAWIPMAGVATAVAALLLAAPRVAQRVQESRTPLDSNRVVVLPVEGSGGQRVTAAVAHQRVMSALMEWRDLGVVEAAAGTPTGIDAADAGRIARRGGAARVLAMSVAPMGDSVEIRATLSDAAGEPVRRQTVRVADDARGGAERYRQFAAGLLRTSDGEDDSDDLNPGTTRVAAWRAFTRGDSLRRAWNLDAAETEFRRAVTIDPSFARAHQWLGQVRVWLHAENRKQWGEEAGTALAMSGKLSQRDSLMAAGLVALSGARFPEACGIYRQLHVSDPKSDVPWYGLGYCLSYDSVVLPSASSASGWVFRASLHAAAAAFDSALAHASGAPTFAYTMLGRILYTEPTQKRGGNSAGADNATFYASPSLAGDTIAFVPYPAADFQQGRREPVTAASAALQRNTEHLESSYREWVRRAPASHEALAALALVQESQGEPQALTSIRTARGFTRDQKVSLSLAVTEIRLLIKQERYAEARQLADSLLRTNEKPDGDEAQMLAGVAAVVGRVEPTAQLLAAAVRADPEGAFRSRYRVPAPMIEAVTSFLAVAASGACPDSLRTYPARLERMLVQYAPAEQRDDLRRTLLSRPMTLAVPCLGAQVAGDMSSPDRLTRMQRAFASGNARMVHAQFDTVRSVRAGVRPGDVALDHTYQEAWILVALGDTAAATRYLDLPLTALPTLSMRLLDDVPSAFALGRALSLRAALASAAGDVTTARKHARAVVSLWSGASQALQPVVQHMRAMSP